MALDFGKLDPAMIIGLVIVMILGTLPVVMVLLAWWRGALSESRLQSGPARIGELTIFDLLATAILIVIMPSLVGGLFLPLLRELNGPTATLAGMVLAQVSFTIIAGLILFRAMFAMNEGLAGFGLRLRGQAWPISLAVIVSLIVIPLSILSFGIVVRLFSEWIGDPAPDIAHRSLQAMLESPSWIILAGLIITAVVMAPINEEIIFRGMLQTALQNSGLLRHRWGAIWIVAILFAAIHIQPTPTEVSPEEANPVIVAEVTPDDAPQDTAAEGSDEEMDLDVPGEAGSETADVSSEQPDQEKQGSGFGWQVFFILLPLSLALGWIYERTGSLWACIVVHALFNGVNIGLVLFVMAPLAE